MPQEPYIRDGEIVRDSGRIKRVCSHFFNWTRFLLLSSIVTALVATNPANKSDFEQFKANVSGRSENVRKKWFKTNTPSWLQRTTNYGIFSLEEDPASLTIHGLGTSHSCNYYDNDPNIGDMCTWIAANLSHQKPLLWDPDDRVHTAHRILCLLLILASAFEFCFPGAFHHLLTVHNTTIPRLFSVFHRPVLSRDLVFTCSFVYPTLKEMNRLIARKYRKSVFESFGNRDLDFFASVCFFVFCLGGGCNWLASRLTSRIVHGYYPVVGASLAYYEIAISSQFFRLLDQNVSNHSSYWIILLFLAFGSMRGRASDSLWPEIVSYILSGMAGTIYGNYHIS